MNVSILLALIVALYAVSVASTGGLVWHYCSSTVHYPVTINNLVLSPNPPKANTLCKAHVDGNLTYANPIKSASSEVKISYSKGGKWIPIGDFTQNVCDFIPCPLNPGPFSLDQSATLPPQPTGDFSGSVTMTDDSNKKLLLCVNFTVSIIA
eukprot:TRINITY_DN1281_c0_g1_i2.p1 TRINITY_DN1281_c0_g1~~TRINITY_DN1281_c0_g1_i2.p1  ORF type:complete len:152 (+),score=30.82 TRINITY_DN1281_c0_g1_i2:49-504(+)